MKVIRGIALYLKRVTDLFPSFLRRQKSIDDLKAQLKRVSDPIEREIKALVAQQDADEKVLTENVAAIGESVLVGNHVLDTEDSKKVSKTVVGPKELFERMKTEAPAAYRAAAVILARLEEEKRVANETNAVTTTKFIWREAGPLDKPTITVAI